MKQAEFKAEEASTQATPNLGTGALRAKAREAQRALEILEMYKDTTFPLNKRAERRRTLKALKKHERAMAIRSRFKSNRLAR